MIQGLWAVVAAEMFWLFLVTKHHPNPEDLFFPAFLVLVTLVLGAITIFALPDREEK
jgi:hypothetical protein